MSCHKSHVSKCMPEGAGEALIRGENRLELGVEISRRADDEYRDSLHTFRVMPNYLILSTESMICPIMARGGVFGI